MKVRDLKAIIDRLHDEDELVISVKTLHATIGPRPSIGVQGVCSGFDWERGKAIIVPMKPVYVGGEDFEAAQKAAHNASEALGFIWMAVANKGLDHKQKVNAVRLTLRARGFDRGMEEEE